MVRLFGAVFLMAFLSGVVSAAAPEIVFPGKMGSIFLRTGEEFRARLDVFGARDVRWYAVTQAPGAYDNVKVCGRSIAHRRNCLQKIPIVAREIESARGWTAIEGLAFPELARLGTKRIAVSFTDASGAQRFLPMKPGGDDVALFARFPEIVVRADDTYAGFLTELIGQPFVFYPVKVPGLGWQTDLRSGGDCVALVIYGQRRLGSTYSYKAPKALHRDLRARFTGLQFAELGRLSPRAVRRGDVLHFGFQTAVIYGADGVLGPDTSIIQSFYDGVAIKKLSELPYRDYPFDVLTWE